MSNQIFLNGTRYISANDAALSGGFTRDYVARLCRDGRVRGQRVGKNWYVDKNSFDAFLVVQEYSKTKRSEELSLTRAREYKVNTSGPLSSGASVVPASAEPSRARAERTKDSQTDALRQRSQDVRAKLLDAVTGKTSDVVRGVSQLAYAPGGFTSAALQAAHVPVYTVTPLVEFLHKLIALTLTVALVFGTYAVVDPTSAHFALQEVRSELATVASSYHSASDALGNAANYAQDTMVATAENPEVAAADVATFFEGGTLSFAQDIARAFNSGVNDLVYSIAFPSSTTASRGIAARTGSGSVSLSIQPYARPSAALAVGGSAASSSSLSGGRASGSSPSVIERVVVQQPQLQSLAQAGGITEAELQAQLQQLDNKLSERMYSLTAGVSTVVTQNYGVTAQTNAIDKLTDVTIKDSTISGGSISGTSIGASSLSVDGNTSLHDTDITGQLNVEGSVTMRNITLASTTLAITGVNGQTSNFLQVKDATGTILFAIQPDGTLLTSNASSTQIYTSLLVAGGATTTSLFTQDLDAVDASTTHLLVAVGATTTNLFATSTVFINSTTTNLFATNASTTNATSTSLFSTLATITTGVITNLTSTFANISGLTVTNSTTTNATTTNQYVTNLQAANASTTNLTWLNATGTNTILTNATTTSLFSTTASSTNLYSTNASFGALQAGTLSLVSTLNVSGLTTFTQGFISQASSTIGNGAQNGGLTVSGGATTTGNAYFASNVGIGTTSPASIFSVQNVANFSTATSTFYSGLAAAALSVSGVSTLGQTLLAAATSTNLFSTTASSTNLYASAAQFGSLTLANPLSVSSGGTASTTLSGILAGNGTAAVKSAQIGSSLSWSGTTLSLNTANPNSWTGLQQFTNATSTLSSVTQKAYFGTLSQSSFDFNGVLTLGAPLAQTSGGTGIGSYTAGDILYADNTGNLAKLPIGSTGNVLTVQAGLPAWGANSSGSSGAGFSPWATTTLQVVYPVVTSSQVVVGGNSTSTLTSIFEVHGNQYVSGNVGIATTSPVTNLSVVGSGYLTGGLGVGVLNTSAGTFQTSGNATIGGTLLLPSVSLSSLLYNNGFNQVAAASVSQPLSFSAGALGLNTDATLHVTGGNLGLDLTHGNSWTGLQQFALASSSVLSVYGPAYFGASATSTFGTNGSLTLAGLGTFGQGFISQASSTIGDGTQAGGLTINGGATTTGNAYFVNKIGIGTQGPGGLLEIKSPSSNGVTTKLLLTDGAGSGKSWELQSGISGVSDAYFGIRNASDNLQALTITNGGNVGIGTTTPWAQLSVNHFSSGASSQPLFVIASSTAANATSTYFMVNDQGNVGIGGTVPATKLETYGTASSSALVVSSLSGLMQANGTSAATAIANSSTAGQVLRVTGASTYGWGALDLTNSSAVTGALGATNGGTGQNSSAWSGVPVVDSGLWSASSTLQVYRGGTGAATFALNGILFGNGASALQATAAAANSILVTNGSNIPSFSTTLPAHTLGGAVTGNGQSITGLGSLTAYASSTIGNGAQNGGLTIAGGATTTGNIVGQGTLALTGTTGTTTIASGQGFTIGSSQFVLQQGSGNVGIGTASPSTLLDVNKNITNGTSNDLLTLNAQTGAYGGIWINGKWNGGTTYGRIGFYSPDNNVAHNGVGLIGGTGTTPDFFVQNGGNVGIGTTTPGTKLDIYNTLSGSTADQLYLTNAASATSTASRLSFRAVDMLGNGTSTAAISSILQQNFAGGNGDLVFSTLQSGILTEVARFNSGGRFGIGTTTPYSRLSVSQTASAPQFTIGYDGARDTEMRVDSGGDLNIEASGNDVYLNNDNFWACTGGSISVNGCPSGTPTGFGNIIAENKIGIGTSTPAYKLTIETQDSTTNFFQIASTTAQSLFVVNANGNVGIGTSTPYAKFAIGPGGSIVETENTVADNGTITVSWLNGNQQKVTLGGNRTINFSNYLPGQILRLVVCQDGTGSRTVTWDSNIIWQSHTAPTLSTSANECDLTTFIATGATSTLKVFGAAATAF